MREREEARARSSRRIAGHAWVCDGCGRERPATSTVVIVSEGTKVAARLCVFCVMRCQEELQGQLLGATAGEADEIERETAIASRGDYDPFAAPPRWEDVWEEVFGGLEIEAAKGAMRKRQGAFSS